VVPLGALGLLSQRRDLPSSLGRPEALELTGWRATRFSGPPGGQAGLRLRPGNGIGHIDPSDRRKAHDVDAAMAMCCSVNDPAECAILTAMANTSPRPSMGPYVPRLLADWDFDAPHAQWRTLPATCCFVDISGFTALSERLERRGRIGAEELTVVLNHVFSRMLEISYGKGGALLKFGGDALLLEFTGDDHPRMAAEAAVAMRAALREARTLPTSVGRVNLRMSVGIHSGTFHLFRVGDSHRELLISGPAATTTTQMEQTADAGEIVISSETASRLPENAVGTPKGDGFLLRWRRVVTSVEEPTFARRSVSQAAVEASIPRALRLRLAQSSRESEHRLASIGFVKFGEVDDLIEAEGPGAAAVALDTVVRTVQRAVDLESVTFLSSDIYANGGKITLTTGVPTAQEDDEGRLLRAVRTLMDDPQPLPISVGVNRGHVFAGDIGTTHRRTFAIMGDAVNFAARLMAAAPPGEIYATAAVLDQARTQFATDTLKPFSAKGKSAPIQAYRVGAQIGSRSYSHGTLPFRGRDHELLALNEALKSARSGHGSTVLVEAERGYGKTRLISEFAVSAKPDHVLWLQGESHRAGIPYESLRGTLRSLLNVDAKDRDRAGEQLLASIEQLDIELLPFAPLLAPIVDADVRSTPQTESIAAEFARQRIADMVVWVLEAACPGLLLLVADDAHWFDDSTSEICARVAGAVTSHRWLLCVIRRAHLETGFTPPDPLVQLPMAPLSDTVARELIEVATEAAPLRPYESDGIVARAGGSPLFLEELLRIVRSTDVDTLPDSLDAVAMREIDTLPAIPRRVLRLASVLGRSFERSLLEQLLAAEFVDAVVDALVDLRAQLIPDADGGRIRFRHALLQEACYQSLPFRQRLALHRTVGEIIELSGADDSETAPMLSLHFLAAQDWRRTWRYARTAARVAQAAHAPGEETIHLERAVTSARRLGAVDVDELGTVFCDLGRSLELLGEYDRADDAYRQAMQAWGSNLPRRAQMACRRAHLRSEFLGRPSSAIRQLRAAGAELALAAPDASGLHALLITEEAAVRQRQGRLAEGLECANQAVREADRGSDKSILARALDLQNTLLVRTGRQDLAIHMDRVLELYEELGDGVQVANVLNNLGNTAFFGLRWNDAADFWARSAEASTLVGDLATTAAAHLNGGDLRVNQGRLEEGLALLGPARRTLESYGYRAAIAWAEMCLGRATTFHGELETGIALVRSALAHFDEIGSQMESLEACARLAEVLVFASRFAEAEEALTLARELDRHVGHHPLVPLVERVELTLAASTNDSARLFANLDGFLKRAESFGATAAYEALVVLVLAERFGDADEQRHEEIRGLMKELGIVTLPMLANE
jgi:class 3 adenylate cyclase/tetratricopeptide (TPR) repeat protein